MERCYFFFCLLFLDLKGCFNGRVLRCGRWISVGILVGGEPEVGPEKLLSCDLMNYLLLVRKYCNENLCLLYMEPFNCSSVILVISGGDVCGNSRSRHKKARTLLGYPLYINSSHV